MKTLQCKFLLPIILLVTAPLAANACGRCGYSRCRYVKTYVKTVPVVKTVVQEKFVPVPVDQSNKSINVNYQITIAEPAAREGGTSYRAYQEQAYFNPLNFNFDAWAAGAQQYQQLAASHAEQSDARVATVVEGIARIQGSSLPSAVELKRLQLAEQLLSGDSSGLELLLKINERNEVSTGSNGVSPSYVQQSIQGNGQGNYGGGQVDPNSSIPPVIQRNCLSCHSGDAPKAKLNLSNVDILASRASDILRVVMDGEMPLDSNNHPRNLSWQEKVEFTQAFDFGNVNNGNGNGNEHNGNNNRDNNNGRNGNFQPSVEDENGRWNDRDNDRDSTPPSDQEPPTDDVPEEEPDEDQDRTEPEPDEISPPPEG